MDQEEPLPFDIRDEFRENNLMLDNFVEEDRVLDHIRKQKEASQNQVKRTKYDLIKDIEVVKQNFTEVLSLIRDKREIIDEAAIKVGIFNENTSNSSKLLVEVQNTLNKESQDFKNISSSLDGLYRQITTIIFELQ